MLNEYLTSMEGGTLRLNISPAWRAVDKESFHNMISPEYLDSIYKHLLVRCLHPAFARPVKTYMCLRLRCALRLALPVLTGNLPCKNKAAACKFGFLDAWSSWGIVFHHRGSSPQLPCDEQQDRRQAHAPGHSTRAGSRAASAAPIENYFEASQDGAALGAPSSAMC